jgi:hypothetical protein
VDHAGVLAEARWSDYAGEEMTRRFWPLIGLISASLFVPAASARSSGRDGLARPLHLPSLKPGAACPVSHADRSVDFASYGVATGIGAGPAYPVMRRGVLLIQPAASFDSRVWVARRSCGSYTRAITGPSLSAGAGSTAQVWFASTAGTCRPPSCGFQRGRASSHRLRASARRVATRTRWMARTSVESSCSKPPARRRNHIVARATVAIREVALACEILGWLRIAGRSLRSLATRVGCLGRAEPYWVSRRL